MDGNLSPLFLLIIPVLAVAVAYQFPVAGMFVVGLAITVGGGWLAFSAPRFAAAGYAGIGSGLVLIALGGVVAVIMRKLDLIDRHLAAQPQAIAGAIVDAMDARYVVVEPKVPPVHAAEPYLGPEHG